MLLKIQEGMLKGIEGYYSDERTLMRRHMINVWLLNYPHDPIQQLRDVLEEQKKFKISQQLVQLTSLGIFPNNPFETIDFKTYHFLQTFYWGKKQL